MKIIQATKPHLSSRFAEVLCSLCLVLLLSAFATQPAFAAKHAAKVIYSFGDVKAAGKKGSRGLKKGDLVYSGESVATTPMIS